MIVHIINFMVWSTLVVGDVTLMTEERKYEPAYMAGETNEAALNYLKVEYWNSVVAICQLIFALYLNSFLMTLILISTSDKEKMVKDTVLGRKVPLLVFIKNRALLKRLEKERSVSEV